MVRINANVFDYKVFVSEMRKELGQGSGRFDVRSLTSVFILGTNQPSPVQICGQNATERTAS